MVEAELRDSTERAFGACGKPIETVTNFKYLRRVMMAGDDDWQAVVGNLVKARNIWGRLAGILSREGADKRFSKNFFKGVEQQVLLFRAETWVLTPWIEQAVESFMHGAARRITGNQPRREGGGGGEWYHPPLREAI